MRWDVKIAFHVNPDDCDLSFIPKTQTPMRYTPKYTSNPVKHPYN